MSERTEVMFTVKLVTRPNMSEPRIDVIVIRHPDYETVTEIYVNGERSTSASIWDFDPGAGYGYKDYAYERKMLERLSRFVPEKIKQRLIDIHEQLRPTYERWSTGGNWPND